MSLRSPRSRSFVLGIVAFFLSAAVWAEGGGRRIDDASGKLRDPPRDGVEGAPDFPRGTLLVELRDGDDSPVRGHAFDLEATDAHARPNGPRPALRTDAAGDARIDGLDAGSGYRIAVTEGPAVFTSAAFVMPEGVGFRVRLHIHPVVTAIDEARVAIEAGILAEVEDDRVQVRQVFVVHNLGRTAWYAGGIRIALPAGATELRSNPSGDRSITAVDSGANLRGTFPPGETAFEFGWDFPYAPGSSLAVTVGLPPNVAVANVVMQTGPGLSFTVDGFPAPTASRDGAGFRVLMAERAFRRDERPTSELVLRVTGLPSAGWARGVAAGLALVAASATAVWALAATARSRRRSSEEELEARAREQARELGAAHSRGEVDPARFEREKQRLIATLAAALARLESP